MTQNVLVGTTKTTVVAAGHKMVMIQNTSGNDVFWRGMEDSGNLTIYPGDFIKVNYDVYLWTDSEDDTTVVIGEIDE